MKKIFAILLCMACSGVFAQNDYKVVRTYHIPSPGGWDYIAVNAGKIYVSQ